MLETILIALIICKLKGYKIMPLFKNWTIYPVIFLEILNVIMCITLFNGNYKFLKYTKIMEVLYIFSYLPIIFKYNQYKNAIEDMAQVRFTRRQFVDKLVPFVLHQMGLLDEDGQPIEKKRNANIVDVYRDQLLAEWSAEDTRNQSNTLVNMWNAITAFESHITPRRNAENPETKFRQIIAGMTLSNIAIEYAANLVNHQLKF